MGEHKADQEALTILQRDRMDTSATSPNCDKAHSDRQRSANPDSRAETAGLVWSPILPFEGALSKAALARPCWYVVELKTQGVEWPVFSFCGISQNGTQTQMRVGSLCINQTRAGPRWMLLL